MARKALRFSESIAKIQSYLSKSVGDTLLDRKRPTSYPRRTKEASARASALSPSRLA